MELYKIPQYLY